MKTYTVKEITTLWNKYNNTAVIRVLRGGRWETVPLNGNGIPRIEGTRAVRAHLSDIQTFPQFLREQDG